MCAISIISYDWDSSESEGKRPKPTPLPTVKSIKRHASDVCHLETKPLTVLLNLDSTPRSRKIDKIFQKLHLSTNNSCN